MAKNVTLTLTQEQYNMLNALLQANGKPAPAKKAEKKLSKADMTREDGTPGTGKNAGKIWWVANDGSDRKWISEKSYDYVQEKRAYASGEKVKTERSQEEKDAYQAYYDAEWAKWKATGKRTSEQNRAKSAEIKAAWKAMNS